MKKILNIFMFSLILSTGLFANTSDDDYGNQNELKELVFELDGQEEKILVEESITDNSIKLDIIYDDEMENINNDLKVEDNTEEKNDTENEKKLEIEEEK